MKKNLLKQAGDRNLFYLQNFNPENRTWSRQTVYFTKDRLPILMTAQRKFFAKKPGSTTMRNYKPVAHYYAKNSKPTLVTKNTPLPRKLRKYRAEEFDKSMDYINTNRADLYSIKRLTLKKHRQKQVATALKAMSALPQNVQRTIMSKVHSKTPNYWNNNRQYTNFPSPNYVPRRSMMESTTTAVHTERPMSSSNIKRHSKYRTQIKKVARGNAAGILKRFNERFKRASGSV